jgi:hypothetical protein
MCLEAYNEKSSEKASLVTRLVEVNNQYTALSCHCLQGPF